MNKVSSAKPKIFVLVWVCRIIVGGAFVFSAITKSVDPWGTIFKFEQYFSAWGMSEPRSLLLGLAILLCIAEFILGISMLTGIYRKSATWCILVLATFFLVLTGYIVISSPVDDCGCFGDAIKMSNGATFFKNLVLVALILILIKYNSEVNGLFRPYVQWIVAVFSVLYILGISLDGYLIRPPLDFRPYPIGTDLFDSGVTQAIFIYEKDGKTGEFNSDDLPSEESGWKFIGRKEISTAGNQLEIYDEEGDNITDMIIPEEGEAIIFVMPEKDRNDIYSSMYINRIKSEAEKNGISTFALIGDATQQDIDDWKDLSMADYDIYSADETQLKQLGRGEQSIVIVENGIIKDKFSLSMVSNAGLQKLEKGEIGFDELIGLNPDRIFNSLTWIYCGVLILLLISSSLVPKKKEETEKNIISED